MKGVSLRLQQKLLVDVPAGNSLVSPAGVEFEGLSKYNEPGPITSDADDVYREVEKETTDFERYRS